MYYVLFTIYSSLHTIATYIMSTVYIVHCTLYIVHAPSLFTVYCLLSKFDMHNSQYELGATCMSNEHSICVQYIITFV